MKEKATKLGIGALFIALMVFMAPNLFAQQLPPPDTGTQDGGCVNQPDNNDGDCTYATSPDGRNTYFCENSFWFDDCVKGL